ncbi:MAG TPA: lysoplasmalogenase [Pyrinomonadaceae bacterium]|nr:lysoplasmalogenase [Pyrinomonadaceae bacterium]
MMTLIVLTLLAFISAVLTILASYQGRRLTLYLFKPLTILFIILIALESKHPTSVFYRYAIIIGLLFSLAGDLFLMLPDDRFIQGLVSFLLAHFCYIAAFTTESGRALSGLDLIPFLIYGGLMLRLLWPHLGKMKAPVIVYMLVILLMGWVAASRWLITGQEGSRLAFSGATLFIASDSLLAVDRFRGRFRSAQLFILGTYFTAQWLIALST